MLGFLSRLNRRRFPIIELTLLRKDRVGDTLVEDAAYPHPFDAVNDSDLPHRDFPPFWNA